MKAKRTTSQFQQVNSRLSEHHRKFGRITINFAVVDVALRTTVCFSRVMAWLALMR